MFHQPPAFVLNTLAAYIVKRYVNFADKSTSHRLKTSITHIRYTCAKIINIEIENFKTFQLSCIFQTPLLRINVGNVT